MLQPTRRQQQVYDFIADYLERQGYPPTLKEIAGHLGISGNLGVIRHLEALEKKGYLQRDRRSSRGIVLPQRGTTRVLPLVGEVRAGLPQLAREDIEAHLAVDATLVRSRDSFLLRVRGDSMIGAHIVDGDLAIVKPQKTACSGDIVVVLLGEEATLKRFYHDSDKVRLQPENPNLEAIIVGPDDDLLIIGRVTGIVRRLDV